MASVVVVCMLLLSVVVVSLGWRGARQTMLDTAGRTANDAAALITEKSQRMLEPAQATLRQLASDPLASAANTAQRLSRLRVLADEITANEMVSSIFVGYASGDFLLVRPLDKEATRQRFEPPSSANFVVQTVETLPNGQRQGAWLFYDAEYHLLERRAKPDYTFDPRTRPWYKASNNTSASVLSAPYVFFTTQQLGVTLSQISHDQNAVFGIDVVLDDLAESLSGLKFTERTELALVDPNGKVLAYPDMSRVLQQVDKTFEFRSIVDLGVAPLIALEAQKPPVGQAVALEVAGEDWLGIVQPYPVWAGQDIHLVIAAPENELLGDLREKRMRLVFMIFAAILGLLPLGWLSGQMIGRSVARLTLQAERMGRFDFSTHASKPSLVKEVNELTAVMDELGGTIQTFLEISQTMATEPRVDLMLNQVLTRMVSATRCSGGVVYLWDAKANHMQIACRTGTLVGHEVAEIPHTPIAQGILIEPLMAPAGLATEKKQQEMRIELRGRGGQLQGLVVLQSAQDREHTEAAFLDFSRKLSGMLAVSIETRQLIESQKNLLDAVIRLMADAIDAKSPYTGGHCERVPELATMLADRMSADTDGPFRDFSMTEDQRYEFYLGAWLHDCGKVTSPEHIVDKATKLEVIYNRIHEVRTRFEVLWRDAEIEHLRRVAGGMDEAASHAIFAARQAQLRDDFAFVAQCNAGGEFMADALIERLRSISGQTWLRHFDNRLGLSGEESRRLTEGEPEPPALPVPEPLLADRPDHVVPWGERRPAVEKNDPNNRFGFDMVLPRYQQNMGEIYNLSIRRGTLTDEDRFKINDHIVQTLIMLKGLPWPQQLARVPEIAANHHEKMDGKGYPRRLPGDQLSVSDRIMALADIFEALTAGDRPYKAPKTLSESLKIMAFMCKDQHIDTVVFRYFLQSGLWQEFAQRFMRPEQIDAVDVAAIERLLPQEASAQ